MLHDAVVLTVGQRLDRLAHRALGAPPQLGAKRVEIDVGFFQERAQSVCQHSARRDLSPQIPHGLFGHPYIALDDFDQ